MGPWLADRSPPAGSRAEPAVGPKEKAPKAERYS